VSSARLSLGSALALASLTLLALAPGAWAAEGGVRALPQPHAGEIVWERVAVRAQPRLDAPRVAVMQQFTPQFHRTVVVAVGAFLGPDGKKPLWYRIHVPGRPNGRTGWVPAASVEVKPVQRQLVIHRGARRLELHERGKVVWSTKVAVGRPGRETPLGFFYVTHRFTPSDPFLGSFAFATSAYSRMTDWPGGGIVGLHGTSMPQLLGQAVSSGCVRLSNQAVLYLKERVQVGTPIRILK
jgi:lipoprotein-anchoring transpeptidase ErfK/SrfK